MCIGSRGHIYSISRLHVTLTSSCVSWLYYAALQVVNTPYITCPIGMTEGLGSRKHKREESERPNKQERNVRFVLSLEVCNVFQYNALQTIIQLQSLNLYIQTSWFTYTVLLLSLKFNKTKYEIISMVQLFLSKKGNLTSPSLFHDLRDNEHYNMAVEDGRFLLHTWHLTNIYSRAKFFWSIKYACKQLV